MLLMTSGMAYSVYALTSTYLSYPVSVTVNLRQTPREDQTEGFRDTLAGRHTDKQDTLITTIRSPTEGGVVTFIR